jgi:hypothetical protein
MNTTTLPDEGRKVNDATLFQRRWPTYSDFAADAGVSYVTAQQWRYRNSIPGEYDEAIGVAAVRRGLATYEATLAELANMRRRRSAST